MAFELHFLSCAPARRAQIGVSSDQLDARCRRDFSTGVARTESQEQTFPAPGSDCAFSDFLRLDVVPGRRTGSHDWSAAITDQVSA